MSEDDTVDLSAIRSIALAPADVVDAFAYTQENPGAAVLRVTPPFHGRMRARIHVFRTEDTEVTGAIHLSPESVLEERVVADYPDLESTLEGADADETDAVRKEHAAAVEAWQERARESIRETVTLETDEGTQTVDLKLVG
ncbi:hypothetical protein SAMN04487967_2455 [Natronorubrum sediminis]|uniref:DUF8009 domain-containing protein n=1 Tax=Natronorubrum sediminis TaxID=640943 RepID=A0A1H6FZA6_9EURY|nr:hypothetical protein [Natronorubrum sediminis]SEH16136.1 hypothetical protein SAMN04487967_2455 [Natronorubrum sediminis]